MYTQDLPHRKKSSGNVPLLDCDDDSISTERSSKIQSSAEISIEEQAKGNCEERQMSGIESDNDHISLRSISQQQEAWSPRTQHTQNAQHNLETTQCFSEDFHDDLDDSIAGIFIYSV